jgi:hypothetical protein
MLLNQKSFFQSLTNYLESKDYSGAGKFLADTEKELKIAVMPDPGCLMCGNVDVDEDGIASVTKDWIRERNEAIAIVENEEGRLFETLGNTEESLKKYKDAKLLLERSNLTGKELYASLTESVGRIEK